MSHEHEHHHHHHEDDDDVQEHRAHGAPLSAVELRVRALESLLTRIIAREVEISPNSRQEIASGVDRRRKIPKPHDQR